MEFEAAAAPGEEPGLWFRTSNLTPAEGSSLKDFPGREFFIARFKRGGREYPGSVMPWEAFARMTDEDIGALYEFFQTLQPQSGPTGDPRFRPGD
jgi:hypothetical protein